MLLAHSYFIILFFVCDIFCVVLVLVFSIFVAHNIFSEFDLDVDDNDNEVSMLLVNHFQKFVELRFFDSLTCKESQVENSFSIDGEDGLANLSSQGLSINFLARPNAKR